MRTSGRSAWIRYLILLSPFIVGGMTFLFPSTDYFTPLNERHLRSEPKPVPTERSKPKFTAPEIPLRFEYPDDWAVSGGSFVDGSGLASMTLTVIDDQRQLESLRVLFSPDHSLPIKGSNFTAALLTRSLESEVLIDRLPIGAIYIRFRAIDEGDQIQFREVIRKARLGR